MTTAPTTTDPRLEEVAEVIGAQRSRTRRIAATTGVASLILGGLSATAIQALASSGDEAANTAPVNLSTVAVEQRDVTLYTEFAGALGYGDAVSIVTRSQGVLTDVPSTGDEFSRGDVVFSVDSEPVVLLFGDLPAWRTLKEGVDAGPDVRQLEANLAVLGYTDGGSMKVDSTFTSATAAALAAFQEDIGLSDANGELAQGDAVFAQGRIRVDTSLSRGTTVTAGSDVLTVALIELVEDDVRSGKVTSSSSLTQNVSLTVSTSDQGSFAVGDPVVVELADGSLADGEVREIGGTPRRSGTGPDSDLVVDISILITAVPDTGLIEGPANVRVIDDERAGVLMVPVRALVALAEGGYAVERSDGAGASQYVKVDTGVFQDGWVEITGDVAAGDTVVVAT